MRTYVCGVKKREDQLATRKEPRTPGKCTGGHFWGATGGTLKVSHMREPLQIHHPHKMKTMLDGFRMRKIKHSIYALNRMI